jgi:hypothetical protein
LKPQASRTRINFQRGGNSHKQFAVKEIQPKILKNTFAASLVVVLMLVFMLVAVSGDTFAQGTMMNAMMQEQKADRRKLTTIRTAH